MNPIRVLHIFNELSNGGNCHFVMNYYRNIDRDKVQFDFLVSTPEKGYFEEEIERLGGRVFHIVPKRHLLKNFRQIVEVVKKQGYQIVHRHTGSAFGYFDLLAAKCGGARGLICHAHSKQAGNRALHSLSKVLFHIKCKRLACSEEAGRWLYGKHKKFTVVNNAVECDRFRFDAEKSISIRAMLGLTDAFVVGHTGAFLPVKNHEFLLKVFREIAALVPDARLVLIGSGPLMDETCAQAKNMGLIEKVLFLGARNDVADLLSAMDVFVLPSLFEGLPIALVEAQTAGLPCVVSDAVPKEADLVGDVRFLTFDKSPEEWAREVIKVGRMVRKREDAAEKISDAGFDIRVEAGCLQRMYLDM